MTDKRILHIAENYLACPYCKVEPGVPCISTLTGYPAKETHAKRLEIVILAYGVGRQIEREFQAQKRMRARA